MMISLSEAGFPVYAALGFLATTILSLILMRFYVSDSSAPTHSSDDSQKKKPVKKSKTSHSDKAKQHTKKSTSTNATALPEKTDTLHKSDVSSEEDFVPKNISLTAKEKLLDVKQPVTSQSAQSSTVASKPVVKEQEKSHAHVQPASTAVSNKHSAKEIVNKEVVEDRVVASKSSVESKQPTVEPNKKLAAANDASSKANDRHKVAVSTSSPLKATSTTSGKVMKPETSRASPLKETSQTISSTQESQKNRSTSESHLTSAADDSKQSHAVLTDSPTGGKKKRRKGKKDVDDSVDSSRKSSEEPTPVPHVSAPVSSAPPAESGAPVNDIINSYTIHLRRRLAESVNAVDQLRKENTELQKETAERKLEVQQLKVKVAEQMTSNQRLREQNMQVLEKHAALEQQWNILQNQFVINVQKLEQMKKQLLDTETKLRTAAKPVEVKPPTSTSSSTNTSPMPDSSSLAMKELQNENTVLLQKLAASEKHVEELRVRVQHLTEELARRHELEQQVFAMKSMVEAKEKEIQKSQTNIQELTSRLRQMQDNEAAAAKQAKQREQEEVKLARASVSPGKVDTSVSKENERKLKQMESEIHSLNEEIAKQREKNDVLRERNWSVMSRLQELEKQPQQPVPAASNQSSHELLKTTSSTERSGEFAAKQKKLQDEVDTLKEKNNELRQRNWIVMEELNGTRAKVEQQSKEIARLHADLSQQVTPLREEVESLRVQLNSCTRVLSNTEHILATLQTSVEEEETKWRNALEASEMECDKARGELQRVYYELQRLQGNTDMSSKISHLTTQLGEVCADRDHKKETIQQLEEKLNEAKSTKPAQSSGNHGGGKGGKPRTKSGSHYNGK